MSFKEQGGVRGGAPAPPRAAGGVRGGAQSPPTALDGKFRIFFVQCLYNLLRGQVPSDLDETCGNSSYKSPGASYTAQGPRKQPETLKRTYTFYVSPKS